MKFDAMDKFNLRDSKDEKRTLILLFFIIFIMIIIFIYLIFLNSTKLVSIKFAIYGLSLEYHDEFINYINDKTLLQVLLPNFKNKLKSIYFIDDVKIYYLPFNKLSFNITEKKSYCIIYDRIKGKFYNVSNEFIVLKDLDFDSFLGLPIISMELKKEYGKGENIEIINNKIDLYNEDYQLSEIIVDKGNFFAIPVKHKYIISFGSFINRVKLENLNLLFCLLKQKEKEDLRFTKIKYIDLSYPDIARIIIDQE